EQLPNDATNPQESITGKYISLIARIWVADGGQLVRGTIEDVHTGARLALDLSELVTFFKTSLAHVTGQVEQPQSQGLPDQNIGQSDVESDAADTKTRDE